MTTRSELEKVKGMNRAGLNTRNVLESLGKGLAILNGVVDEERTAALAMPASTKLTLTSTELAGFGDLDNIGVSANCLQKGSGSTGLRKRWEGGGSEDERDGRSVRDTVAAGEDEWERSRSRNSRSGSETPN